MTPIRALLIDDERLAREELSRMLGPFQAITIVGEAASLKDALVAVRQYLPDLLFLDVQLAGASGFDLLEQLDPAPEVIFVTAYDRYAVQAFEANALDYLMKPVRAERLAQVIKKTMERLSVVGSRRLFIKDGLKCHWIALADISLIESVENYARLYYSADTVFLKRSLNQLESQLAGDGFFRANRAQLINTAFVKRVEQAVDGRLLLHLPHSRIVELSERQSVKFKAMNKI